MIKSIRLIVPCINVFGHSLIIFYYFINKLLTYIIICDINILKEFFCGQHMYFNYKYISI